MKETQVLNGYFKWYSETQVDLPLKLEDSEKLYEERS